MMLFQEGGTIAKAIICLLPKQCTTLEEYNTTSQSSTMSGKGIIALEIWVPFQEICHLIGAQLVNTIKC